MINWINCQDKMPPQNEKLLFCAARPFNESEWHFGPIVWSVYRFGAIDGIAHAVKHQVKGDRFILFWARENKPIIKEGT